MKSLPDCAEETFVKIGYYRRQQTDFQPYHLLDQAHEQENAKVKGKGGVVGLTENPTALKRWMIAGPEFARLNTEFESLFLPEMDPDINSRHHEKGLALQQSFKKQVTSLIHVIEDFGNPFMDSGPELVVLSSRECVNDEATSSVRQVEVLGKLQYDEFKRDEIDVGGKGIHKSIKKNELPLLSAPKTTKHPTKHTKYQIFMMMLHCLVVSLLPTNYVMVTLMYSLVMKISFILLLFLIMEKYGQARSLILLNA